MSKINLSSSPEGLANAFLEMTEKEKAEFFNHIGKDTVSLTRLSLGETFYNNLNFEGKKALKVIGLPLYGWGCKWTEVEIKELRKRKYY